MEEVIVVDRGPGIPVGNEQRLFDKFYRVPGVDGGGVLGLAICKGIVAAHTGRISVANRLDGGAEFQSPSRPWPREPRLFWHLQPDRRRSPNSALATARLPSG